MPGHIARHFTWNRGHGFEQQGLIDRFREIAGAADFETPRGVAFHDIGRERDDRRGEAAFAKFARCRVAVHDRHLHIHENQIEGLEQRALDGLEPVFGFLDSRPARPSTRRISLRFVSLSSTTSTRCSSAGKGSGLRAGRWPGLSCGGDSHSARCCKGPVAISQMKVVPWPSWLTTRTEPPSCSANRRLIERPRPVPPYLRVIEESACVKGSKIDSSWSEAMPMPVS